MQKNSLFWKTHTLMYLETEKKLCLHLTLNQVKKNNVGMRKRQNKAM